MAMDLRRRNKQHVMETMDGKTPAPRAHEFACAHGDEPLIQRVGAYCLASGYSSDCRLDFDDGGRREEKRVLVGLNPVSKAVRSPLGRARESIARSWALARVAAALDTAHQKMRRRLRIWSNSNRYGSATSLFAAMTMMSWEKTEVLYQLKLPSRTR